MYMYMRVYIYIYIICICICICMYVYIFFRHTLFSLFDLGCMLDHESWYSVRESTPLLPPLSLSLSLLLGQRKFSHRKRVHWKRSLVLWKRGREAHSLAAASSHYSLSLSLSLSLAATCSD